VVPVVNLDARPISNGRPGTITKRLNKLFREQVATDGSLIAEAGPRPKWLGKPWGVA
jgi:hypothetical protein